MDLGLGFLFLNVLAIVIVRGTLLRVRGHKSIEREIKGRRVMVEEGNRYRGCIN